MIGTIIIFVAKNEPIFHVVKAKGELVNKRIKRNLPNEEKFVKTVKDLQIVKINFLSAHLFPY